jgi:hypothetical protein
MEDLILQALIKEAAAEELLEEAELLKIAAKKRRRLSLWVRRHPVLAGMGAGLLGSLPLAVEKFITKEPESGLGLLAGGLIAGGLFGGLQRSIIAHQLRQYKELGIV